MLEGLIVGALALGIQSGDGDRERLIEVARVVMTAAGHCALITLDEEGAPRARTMDPFPPGEDLTVWMGTNADTRKVADLRRDSRATLYYFDAEGGGYVSLTGTVEAVDDPERKRRHWKDAWGAFYENRHRGDDYLLLRFVPERLELVSLEFGVASDPKGWKPAILDLRPDAR